MPIELDKRIVKITFITQKERIEYKDLYVSISGEKLTNSSSANADIEIYNLSHDLRQYILSHTVPRPTNIGSLVKVVVEVGRESYGTSILFQGQVYKSQQTDKPNIGLKLHCIAGYVDKYKVTTVESPSNTTAKDVAKKVASDLGLHLNFSVPDFNIGPYHFMGTHDNHVKSLSEMMGTKGDVFIDDNVLTVKPPKEESKEQTIIDLSKGTGLIRANATQAGATITMLYDPTVKLNSLIKLTTIMNSSLNGNYSVFRIRYSITSRDRDFYLHADCRLL